MVWRGGGGGVILVLPKGRGFNFPHKSGGVGKIRACCKKMGYHLSSFLLPFVLFSFCMNVWL